MEDYLAIHELKGAFVGSITRDYPGRIFRSGEGKTCGLQGSRWEASPRTESASGPVWGGGGRCLLAVQNRGRLPHSLLDSTE